MTNTRRILEALAEEFGGTDVRQIVMAHTSEGWSRRSRAELQPGEITSAHHYTASGLDYVHLIGGFAIKEHQVAGRHEPGGSRPTADRPH